MVKASEFSWPPGWQEVDLIFSPQRVPRSGCCATRRTGNKKGAIGLPFSNRLGLRFLYLPYSWFLYIWWFWGYLDSWKPTAVHLYIWMFPRRYPSNIIQCWDHFGIEAINPWFWQTPICVYPYYNHVNIHIYYDVLNHPEPMIESLPNEFQTQKPPSWSCGQVRYL